MVVWCITVGDISTRVLLRNDGCGLDSFSGHVIFLRERNKNHIQLNVLASINFDSSSHCFGVEMPISACLVLSHAMIQHAGDVMMTVLNGAANAAVCVSFDGKQ